MSAPLTWRPSPLNNAVVEAWTAGASRPVAYVSTSLATGRSVATMAVILRYVADVRGTYPTERAAKAAVEKAWDVWCEAYGVTGRAA